jgi:hypothetical protein
MVSQEGLSSVELEQENHRQKGIKLNCLQNMYKLLRCSIRERKMAEMERRRKGVKIEK